MATFKQTDKKNDMSNSSKAAVAFLAGIAIGAGLGILFAPDEGSKTRKKLKDNFDEKKDEFKKKFDELSSSIKSKLELSESEIQSAAEDVVGNADEKTNEIVENLEKKLADLKAAASKMNR